MPTFPVGAGRSTTTRLVVRRFSRFSRETLAVAVAAAMPGYMAGGAFTPFIADRIAWIASKVANRASLESLDTRRTR